MSDQQPADSGPAHIDRDSIYKPHHLSELLGVPLSGVLRAIRAGELRSSRRRGRTLVLGAWVLQWLEAGEVRRRTAGNGAAANR